VTATPGASGPRSIASTSNNGWQITGDNATVNTVKVPRPDDVPKPGRLWNVPRRPSAVFVGRDPALRELAGVLAAGSGVVGQSVAGLGGVGKTELALHHVFAVRDRWPVVWWIVADSPTGVGAGLAGLARRLEASTAVLGTEAMVEWVLAWLGCHEGWMLVLDNVDNPDHIAPLLAMADQGRVLVTTRRDIDWTAYGLTPVRLRPLDSTEGSALLLERIPHVGTAADTTAAEYIARELGGLPLALEQAAAYITQHHTTLTAYARLLTDQPDRMYAEIGPVSDAQRAVARVWDITLTALTAIEPAAVHVLSVLAWLASDELPRPLIDYFVNNDRATADRLLGLLASHSMITLTENGVSVHRLVQAVLRSRHSETVSDGLPTPAQDATAMLNDAAPGSPQTNVEGWLTWRSLITHITALAEHSPDHNRHAPLGYLLNQAGSTSSRRALQLKQLNSTREPSLSPRPPTAPVAPSPSLS
jgi:hypothetical protein